MSLARKPVEILGIATATPPVSTPQSLLTQMATQHCCDDSKQAAWLERIFGNSAVGHRGSVLIPEGMDPLSALTDFYPPRQNTRDLGPGTRQRMAVYEQHAPKLAAQVGRAAVTAAQTSPQHITHLVTASCTGFVAPGLDVAIIGALRLNAGVRRLHLGFMGCHAAFNALAAAADSVRATPGATALVCCVELCSLHFAYGWSPDQVVANALFADGAAAAVLGSGATTEPHWSLIDTASQLLPDSLDVMTWHIGNHGFNMTLSSEVPSLVGRHLRPWLEPWLLQHGLKVSDIAGWAIHPGGPKVLSAVANCLELPDAALRPSRHVLADHGNMSSATLLFVLDRLAATGVRGPCVALGFGPGLMAEALLLRR